MAGDAQETFADQIYEAAVIPELWPSVLAEFARMAEAKGSVLIVVKGTEKSWIASDDAIDQDARRHYEYSGAHERTRRLLAARHVGFVADTDVFTEQEILSEPLFSEFLIPSGYGRGVATAVLAPSGETIVFHAEGNYQAGPLNPHTIPSLDGIRRHLARASLLSARLGLQRARAAAQALETVGLPAALIGQKGGVVAANRLFEKLIPDVFQDRASRLVLTESGADSVFAAALARLGLAQGHLDVRSIPIPAREPHGHMIVHLVPIRRQARDIFSVASAIIVVTPLAPDNAPGADVIQGLFDLTPAEAKIAQAIANGATVDAIAAATGVSVVTVRNQLNRVLTKSGLHRQSELVGLLRSAGAVSGDPAS